MNGRVLITTHKKRFSIITPRNVRWFLVVQEKIPLLDIRSPCCMAFLFVWAIEVDDLLCCDVAVRGLVSPKPFRFLSKNKKLVNLVA